MDYFEVQLAVARARRARIAEMATTVTAIAKVLWAQGLKMRRAMAERSRTESRAGQAHSPGH